MSQDPDERVLAQFAVVPTEEFLPDTLALLRDEVAVPGLLSGLAVNLSPLVIAEYLAGRRLDVGQFQLRLVRGDDGRVRLMYYQLSAPATADAPCAQRAEVEGGQEAAADGPAGAGEPGAGPLHAPGDDLLGVGFGDPGGAPPVGGA
jgi:hypothetical protein